MSRVFALATFTAALLLSTSSNATVFNLTTDWSTVNNPTGGGVWAYRGDNTVLPTFFPSHPQLGDDAWAPGNVGGGFLPGFFKATVAQFGWSVGDVVTHTPDQANGSPFITSNVLFTAPAAGNANISGSVWNARVSAPLRPQEWRLYLNGVLQTSDSLPGDTTDDRNSPDTFSLLNISLLAGDTVMLEIFRTGPGTSTGDFVGMDITVNLQSSEVPLPAALPLFATGLGALGFLGWRRKRRTAAVQA